MTAFDPTDPAAEIKHLKALESAKAAAPDWPADWPAPAKAKKQPWPTAPAPAKKKPPWRPHSWLPPEEEPARPFVQYGIPLEDVIRYALIFAALLAIALLVD